MGYWFCGPGSVGLLFVEYGNQDYGVWRMMMSSIDNVNVGTKADNNHVVFPAPSSIRVLHS